ncbi:DNA-binding protein WhiA [Thermodesulfitimonas sp.]
MAQITAERPCCLRSELAGLARAAGQVVKRPEGPCFEIHTESPAVARKALRLARAVFGLQGTLIVRHQRRLRGRRLFCLVLPGDLATTMAVLGLTDRFGRPFAGIRRSFVRRACCRRAYLRGLFLGRGWVNGRGPSYHLEFVTSSEALAHDLLRLLAGFGLDGRINVRQNHHVVYLKRGGAVSDCLRLMGASGALLDFENQRVLRDVKNRVNRLVNCDTANLNKTVEAALQRKDEIELISARLGLENLPKELSELAALRLSHPEATLKELGEMMRPPVSKSCINHRLRRLSAIARQLAQDADRVRGQGL